LILEDQFHLVYLEVQLHQQDQYLLVYLVDLCYLMILEDQLSLVDLEGLYNLEN